MIAKLKDKSALLEDQSDMQGCFVACGGNEDGSGAIDKDKLIKLLTTEFSLPVEMEEVVKKLDVNKDGDITFRELKNLLR